MVPTWSKLCGLHCGPGPGQGPVPLFSRVCFPPSLLLLVLSNSGMEKTCVVHRYMSRMIVVIGHTDARHSLGDLGARWERDGRSVGRRSVELRGRSAFAKSRRRSTGARRSLGRETVGRRSAAELSPRRAARVRRARGGRSAPTFTVGPLIPTMVPVSGPVNLGPLISAVLAETFAKN